MRAEEDAEFTAFVAQTHRQLLRSARLLTGDWHSAEDLVQTALLKVYRRWRRVRAAESALAFTQQVMVNLFLSSLRRRWHGETPHGELPEPSGSVAGGAAGGGDPGSGVGQRDALERLLRQLPRRQRAVVVLRYYEDMSVEQTAQLLSCSEATVRSQAARGLARLRAEAGLRELLAEEGR